MSKNVQIPRINEDIVVQELGDEVLLLNSRDGDVHILNETAYIVWNLCDGRHTLSDIQKNLMNWFPEMIKHTVDEDVQHVVNDFKDKSLIY